MKSSYRLLSALAEALGLTFLIVATVLSLRRFRLIAILIGLAYAASYLMAIQNLVYMPGIGLTHAILQVQPNWVELFWKPIRPFTYEPIALIRLSDSLVLLVSVPNLLIAAILSALVALNLTLAVYGLTSLARSAKAGGGSALGIVSALPSLLASSACCVPTAAIFLSSLLAVGSSLSLLVVTIGPILFPTSLAGLAFGLLWSGKNLSKMMLCDKS